MDEGVRLFPVLMFEISFKVSQELCKHKKAKKSTFYYLGSWYIKPDMYLPKQKMCFKVM